MYCFLFYSCIILIMDDIKIYEPDNILKNGYFSMYRQIFKELKSNKWLLFQLFKKNIFTAYKQSLFGILWAIIIPILSVLTFVLLNRSGIFVLGKIKVPYAIYAIFGLSFWQFFSTGLISGSNSLIEAGSMIVKINFSKKTLVIASMGRAFVSSLIQLILVSILFFVYGVTPTLNIFFIPLLFLPVIFFTMGFSFIFSILNGIFRDIGNILSVIMTFLLLLTPVLYVKPETGLFSTISNYNILYYLISFPRDLVLFGDMTNLIPYLISSACSIGFFLLFILIFHITETRIAERI